MKNIIECEYKWDAYDRNDFANFLEAARSQASLKGPKEVVLEDSYFDSKDKYFSKSQTSCRVRKEDKKFTLTLKNSGTVENGMAKREEKNIPLSARSYDDAVKEAGGILGRELTLKFSLTNDRTLYELDGKFGAELCFDAFTINLKGGKLAMKEVEMEFKNGDFAAFKKAAETLGRSARLKFAKNSKVKNALSALNFALPK